LGRVVGHFGFHHVLLLKALPLTPSFHLFTLLQSDWTKTTSSESLGSISNIGGGFARHQVENESTYSQSFCPSPEPTGQHLFVDIKNVNKTFLHSDEQTTLATVSSRRTELFQPDRFVYLDKVMQNRPLSFEAYHEALVHPAMMTHANPRRVAIVGSGHVATLREVLKHKTVETCVMIEIDEMMAHASKTARCFDDPRVEMYYDNAVAWFVNRFSSKENVLDEDKFDVIIIDAL
jgi:Spermine/spermidine synthase domain